MLSVSGIVEKREGFDDFHNIISWIVTVSFISLSVTSFDLFDRGRKAREYCNGLILIGHVFSRWSQPPVTPTLFPKNYIYVQLFAIKRYIIRNETFLINKSAISQNVHTERVCRFTVNVIFS